MLLLLLLLLSLLLLLLLLLFKPTRSVKITCSTHTPGGCSLNFAQPVAGRSFSDMPWRVPGFTLEAWALRGRCHREVATLWLQMFELVGSEIANDADPRLAGEAATCPRTSGPCARCRPLDLRIIGQLNCGCALVPLQPWVAREINAPAGELPEAPYTRVKVAAVPSPRSPLLGPSTFLPLGRRVLGLGGRTWRG